MADLAGLERRWAAVQGDEELLELLEETTSGLLAAKRNAGTVTMSGATQDCGGSCSYLDAHAAYSQMRSR